MPQEAQRNSPNPSESSQRNLEGFKPVLVSDQDLRDAVETAFDYRGDVTIYLQSGEKIEGYIFDRQGDGKTLADCFLRLFPKDRPEKVTIKYSEIAGLHFTGRDTAAGKSFETWMKKYKEKKAAGEKNIGLEPEKLE